MTKNVYNEELKPEISHVTKQLEDIHIPRAICRGGEGSFAAFKRGEAMQQLLSRKEDG